MTSPVHDRLTEIVAPRLNGDKADLVASGTLLTAPIKSLGLDSLDHLEIIMAVEDSFDVMLDEDHVMACETLAEIGALVETARAPAA